MVQSISVEWTVRTCAHMVSMYSSSCLSSELKSSSFMISTLVVDSPFLYSVRMGGEVEGEKMQRMSRYFVFMYVLSVLRFGSCFKVHNVEGQP